MNIKLRKRIATVSVSALLVAVMLLTYFVLAVTNFKAYGTSLAVNKED